MPRDSFSLRRLLRPVTYSAHSRSQWPKLFALPRLLGSSAPHLGSIGVCSYLKRPTPVARVGQS